MNDADCVAFLQWALPRLGLHWPGYRKVRRQVCKRIRRRSKELGAQGLEEYRKLLGADAAEWAALGALCAVSISRFYRDRSVFDCLGERVLPAIAAAALARGADSLECWSAGCASGEETYSLVIQWRELLAARFPALALRALGTDLEPALLERARAGCYKRGSLKELPHAWRERAFEERANLLCLRQAWRAGVELERRDLLAEPPPRTFDLVLCRNLAFTYFGPESAHRALARIASVLRPGGALVIGAHERLPADAAGFAAWPECRAVYRRESAA
jgi:chemotaxis protein methyltransferase CheR